jgi:hypothetical protein
MYLLARVSKIRPQYSNAGSTLEILGIVQFIEHLFNLLPESMRLQINDPENPGKYLFEALHIPVLVDDSVYNCIEEYLVHFLAQKIPQIMHHTD